MDYNKYMEEININLGVADDLRSEEAKAKDYQHADLAGSVIINWREKPESEWKKYTPREQDGSLSCVAQSAAKGGETLGLGNGEVLSAHPIYRPRANYPSGGMWPQNCGEIFRTIGTTTETLDPSQFQNETLLNRDVGIETPIKTKGYAFPKHEVIDEIAQAIELNKHCMLLVRCNRFEWTAVPKYNGKAIDFHHEVCGIDYFIYKGEKAILVEDSTGHFNSFDGKGRRILTETFNSIRLDNAMYLIKDLTEIPYVFKKTLRQGSRGIEVKMLQIKLGGLTTDGIFGLATLRAVKSFQTSHGLVADGIVGPMTNAELNKL
jgi:peptidoglycan hydrolase-like protein with peptidoglycan-binding domain